MENTENGYAILLIREIFVYPKRKQHDTIGEKDKGEFSSRFAFNFQTKIGTHNDLDCNSILRLILKLIGLILLASSRSRIAYRDPN